MRNKRVLPALLGSVALTLGLVTVTTSVNKEVVNAAEEYVKADSIAVGDEVLLVYEGENMELSGISTTKTKYGIGNKYTDLPVGAFPLEVVEGASAGTYALKNGSNYLYWTSGNSLATNTTLSANTSWKISFDNGNAIILNGKDNTRKLQWNASSPRFACYTSAQTAIQLYKKDSGNDETPSDIADKEVSELVNNYVDDGIYTKKTSINLERNPASPDTLEELAELGFDNLFHASESTLKRTTYYNDKDLLMANYNGSIKGVDGCTDGINSGYGTVTIGNFSAVKEINKNVELGDMTHFKYDGETQVYDYIVKKGQHTNWIDDSVDGMEGFYLTPRDFTASDYFNGWNYNADNECYYLEVTNTDPIVADFVNVVAPLLLDDILESNYISVTSLIIKETAEGLVLQIIANGDTGKLVDGTNVLAEAIITDNCDVDFSYVSDSPIFNLGENGDATHDDGTSNSDYSETVGEYTLSITGGTKMYTGARDAKGNSCIKLGTGSAASSFEFTVPENVNSAVIYVAGYKANIAKIEVNGTSYEINTFSNNGEYTPIEIDTSSTKTISFKTLSGGYRCMINAIEFIAG